MKKLIVFIGIALVLIGVRYHDGGIFTLTGGKLTVYSKQDVFEIFTPTGADTYRIDLPYNFDVDALLDECNGKIMLTENDGSIIYVYTALITTSVWVHGKRVNMMIHKGKTSVNIGVPILKGSY